MKIAVSTHFFPNDPIELAIEKLAGTGTEYVEIIWDLPHFSPVEQKKYNLKKLRSAIDTYRLGVTVHAPFFDLNLGSIYPEIRKFSIGRFKKCIEFCFHIGSDLMVIHPGHSPLLKFQDLYLRAKDGFIEGLREIVDYATSKGIVISLENISSPYFFAYDSVDLSSLAKKIKNLGITLDIGHAFIMKLEKKRPLPEEEIANEIRGILRPFLKHVHIHDNEGRSDEHLGLGKGKINFIPIFQALKDIDFSGRVVLESWEPDQSLNLAEEQLKIVKELLKY